jgi:hypothetical protein
MRSMREPKRGSPCRDARERGDLAVTTTPAQAAPFPLLASRVRRQIEIRSQRWLGLPFDDEMG